jgi:membrane-associated phospholipid phosphatase
MLAYFLAVGLIGVCGQYLLSSGGPIFYDRILGTDRFPDLMERIRAHAPIAHAASDYLWQSFLAGDTSIGNGISAMPSMHVATTTWAAIVLGRIMPKTTLLIWGFWVVILAGSVALGWHYLSDGVVGAGGAYLCWRMAPYFLAAISKLPWTKALSPANQS